MLANWKHKPTSHTLGPIQSISTIVEKFHVPLEYVRRCESTPKMLESLWAIRFLKVSDAETPEDVKATLNVFHLVEDGVEAVWRVFDCRSWAPELVQNSSPNVRRPTYSLSIAASDGQRSTSRMPFLVFRHG